MQQWVSSLDDISCVKHPLRVSSHKRRIKTKQSKTCEELLQFLISTSTAGTLTETDIWSVKEHLQQNIKVLCQNVINSEEQRMANKIVKEQFKYNIEQIFYSRIKSVSKETTVDIKARETMSKPSRKKLIKQKIKKNTKNYVPLTDFNMEKMKEEVKQH